MAELIVSLGETLGVGFCCSLTVYSGALTLPSLAWNPVFDENDMVTNPLPEAFRAGEFVVALNGERHNRMPWISFKGKIDDDTVKYFERLVEEMKETLRKEQLIIDSGLETVGVEDVERILTEDWEKQKCPETH